MELFFVILVPVYFSVILGTFTNYVHVVESDQIMIQVVHPDVEAFYLDILRSAEDGKNTEFLEMTNEEKRQMCLYSVQSYIFHVVEKNGNISKPVSLNMRASIEEIKKYYDRTSMPVAVKYYSIATLMKNLILEVKAHRCLFNPEKKWFLAYGDDNMYIVLGKDRKDHFTVRGLLEPVAEIASVRSSKEKYAMDAAFVRKMEDVNAFDERHWNNRRSICELTDLQRVLLCSAVYVPYQQLMDGQLKRVNTLRRSKSLCLKNGLVELKPDEASLETTTMDLISCSVGEDSSVPLFYLADDVYSTNSAYVLHRTNSTETVESQLRENSADPNSSSIITYQLVLHVRKLTQLGNSYTD